MSNENQTDESILSFNAADSEDSRAELAKFMAEQEQKLQAFPPNGNPIDLAIIKRDLAEAAVGLGQMEEAWVQARQAFNVFLAGERWQEAVECCEILFRTDQPASIVALGHAMWLAVTYPIDPQLTINILNYFVEETPAKADGAAVVAIVAHYVADMRATDDAQRESLMFLTNNMVFQVAQRHSGVQDQTGLSAWLNRMELLDPAVFLKRYGLVVGAIVPNEEWWFDRDELRAKIPDQ